MGMNQARQVINQLEHESNGRDPLANEMAELLFGQLVMTLNGIATRPTIFRQPPEKPCWIN